MRIPCLLPLLVATGCGGGLGSQNEVTEARIEAMEDLMAVLEGIGSKDDLGAAAPKVEKIMARAEEIAAAAKKLGEPGAGDRKRLEEKLAAAQEDLQPRMERIRERLRGDPDTMVAVSKMMMEAVLKMGK